MKYNGKELKEYRSEEPIFFDPPKRMLCWNRDRDIPIECRVFSYENRPSISVVVAEAAEDDMPQTWKHCAEIPEEYFALVVVEHRAVSGINRYGLGKFVTREYAKFVMDRMVELLGGDPQTGSKDIYIVPFNAVRGFPIFNDTIQDENIPRYIMDAYYEAVEKFLNGPKLTPRIKDLPTNAGEVYAPREETPRLESFKEQAAEKTAREDNARDVELRTLKNKMVAELVYKSGWGAYHCMKALQACEWKPDAAERMLKEKFKDFATKK